MPQSGLKVAPGLEKVDGLMPGVDGVRGPKVSKHPLPGDSVRVPVAGDLVNVLSTVHILATKKDHG